MQSDDYPSLLSLMRTHAQLASDARRIEQIVDGYLDDVERLFRAATMQDWPAIARATRRIAHESGAETTAEVVQAAKELSRAIRSDRPLRSAPLRLTELLQTCREQQQRRTA